MMSTATKEDMAKASTASVTAITIMILLCSSEIDIIYKIKSNMYMNVEK